MVWTGANVAESTILINLTGSAHPAGEVGLGAIGTVFQMIASLRPITEMICRARRARAPALGGVHLTEISRNTVAIRLHIRAAHGHGVGRASVNRLP
jgi:hypothetical protein